MAQKMLDVLGYAVPRTSDGKAGALPCPEPVVISKTPIIIFREMPSMLRGSKRTTICLQLTQVPPAQSLEEERPLKPHGMPRSWGYVFNTGEPCFYQLEEGETPRPLAVSATLTSNDWSVLKMVVQQHLRETSQENIAEPVSSKRPRLDNLPTCTEVLLKIEVFSGIWQSKVVESGRWYFRTTLRSMGKKKSAEFFVLES